MSMLRVKVRASHLLFTLKHFHSLSKPLNRFFSFQRTFFVVYLICKLSQVKILIVALCHIANSSREKHEQQQLFISIVSTGVSKVKVVQSCSLYGVPRERESSFRFS